MPSVMGRTVGTYLLLRSVCTKVSMKTAGARALEVFGRVTRGSALWTIDPTIPPRPVWVSFAQQRHIFTRTGKVTMCPGRATASANMNLSVMTQPSRTLMNAIGDA